MSFGKLNIAYMFGGMNRGGAETIMLDLFRNHQRATFSFIGIHRKGGAYRDAFYNAGPNMAQLTPKRFGYVGYLLKLRRLLKQEGITVVHTQHWLDCIYAWLATMGMRVQIVNTFHGFYSMKGIAGWLCRMSIRMADDVCFVSKYEQDWYQRQMRIKDERCHIIFNGVDFQKIDMAGKREEVRGKSRIKLCMVGNFMTGRDHLTLVKALTLVESRKSKVESFDFYFVGKRSEATPYIYDECVRICEENGMKNVHFLGARSDVPALLKQMDGFVYSTDHDTFGIAVVEAMAARLPIVVNDWPVMKEVCGESGENYVRYFKSKDADSCAEAILQLQKDISASSAEFKLRCARNAQWARERYSIESYIATLSQIYRKD